VPVNRVSVTAERAALGDGAPAAPADPTVSLGTSPGASTPAGGHAARAGAAQSDTTSPATPRAAGDPRASPRSAPTGRGSASSTRTAHTTHTAAQDSVHPGAHGACPAETGAAGVSFEATLAASLAESSTEPDPSGESDPPSAPDSAAKTKTRAEDGDTPTSIAALVAFMSHGDARVYAPVSGTAAASATTTDAAAATDPTVVFDASASAAAPSAAQQSTLTPATSMAGGTAAVARPDASAVSGVAVAPPPAPTAALPDASATPATQRATADESGSGAPCDAGTASPATSIHGAPQSPPQSLPLNAGDGQNAAPTISISGAASLPSAASTNGAPTAVANPHDAATVTLAAQAQMHAPVGTNGWSDELGVRLTLMAHTGIGSASLRLTPESLGPLEVRIAVRDSTASVWFGAQHPDTRVALEQALPRLRELFAAQGLNLTDAGVSREPPGETQRNPRGTTAAAGSTPALVTGGSLSAEVRAPSGLIDTYA